MSSFFDLVASLQASFDDLDSIISGGDTETVSVNGVSKDTISKAIKDKFSALSAMMQGRLPFGTKALMDANTSQERDTLAEVWNDLVPGNNGIYGWTGSKWNKSVYSIQNVIDSTNKTVAVSGSAVFGATNNTVKSYAQTTLDRFNILSDSKLFNESEALIYTDAGTVKAQSTTTAGYATALTTSAIGDFDKVDFHIIIDSPTVLRVSVLNSSLVKILSVDINGVTGFNEASLPRLVGAADDSTLYIGVETINRAPMTVTTIYPTEYYAPTGTFPVKKTLISGSVGSFDAYASSQYQVPFRLWNSHALMVEQHFNVESQAKRVAPILANSLTTAMADTKTGELLDTYVSFSGTTVGVATAYLSPEISFDSFRTAIRIESDSALRIYLKNETLDTIESVDTDLLIAGDHFLTMTLSKFYNNVELGTQFYIAVESIGHVSRMATRQSIFDENKFPQPTSAYPLKSSSAEDITDTWSGGGSSTVSRLYVEFSKLKNIASSLALAIANADGSSLDADDTIGVVERGNVDTVSGDAVFQYTNNTVKSDIQTSRDRFEIVADSGLFNDKKALVYTDSGTPKSQSTTTAGYATALTVSEFGDFDKVDFHIILASPTPCRLSVLDSQLNKLLSVDFSGVDGWNQAALPRLVGDRDDSTLYIGIETVNRDPMSVTTIYPAEYYAPAGTFSVKKTLISGDVGSYDSTVSSQYQVPFRLWNSHALMVEQHRNVERQVKRVAPIIAATLTTSMADNKGGSLLDVYSNYMTTLVGYATAYLTPSTAFNAMRTPIRIESSTALRLYLKTETLDDIEFVDTDVLPAGDHFLSIALSKSYSSSELGTQFYVAVESIGHVSRVAPRNFTAVEANFPQPTNAFPTKSVAAASDVNTWIGGGSSTALRQYVEFFKLKNVSGALATAVSNAEASSITKLAIPSQIYAIDGLNNQNIYYSNITKSPSSDQYLFDIGAGLTGRMKAKSWQNRRTVAGVSILNSKLYNRDRVLLDSKLSTVTTISKNAGTGKTPVALVIGDSITARGFYTQDLLDLASTDVMGLTLLGTEGAAQNNHEGYGGKTVDWFYTNEASPFVFNGIFDFSQYMSTNSYASVDYVIMHLGVNDIFPATDDTNAVSISNAASVQIEAMIASFKLFNPSIKFGLMLPITPSFDQDAWGIVYSDAATYWRYNSSRGEWCNTMIANFDNRLGEDIYVLPTNCTIDIETAYNVGDPIHPIDNGTGYQAMADTVWAFMKVKES